MRSRKFKRRGGGMEEHLFPFQSERVVPNRYNAPFSSEVGHSQGVYANVDVVSAICEGLKKEYDVVGLDSITLYIEWHGEIQCARENTVLTTLVPPGVTFYRLMLNEAGTYGIAWTDNSDMLKQALRKHLKKLTPASINELAETLHEVYEKFMETVVGKNDFYKTNPNLMMSRDQRSMIGARKCMEVQRRINAIVQRMKELESTTGGGDEDGASEEDDADEVGTVVAGGEEMLRLQEELEELKAEGCSGGVKPMTLQRLRNYRRNYERSRLEVETFSAGEEVLNKKFYGDGQAFVTGIYAFGLRRLDGKPEEDVNLIRFIKIPQIFMSDLFGVVERLGIKNVLLVDYSCSSMSLDVKNQPKFVRYMKERRLGGKRTLRKRSKLTRDRGGKRIGTRTRNRKYHRR